MKRIAPLVGVALSTLLIIGCSSISKPKTSVDISQQSFTEQDAMAKYKATYNSDFPEKGGEWQTVYRKMIHNRVLFKLQVETLYNKTGNESYIITFNEQWLAIDDPRYPSYLPSNKSTLSHQIRVEVTPTKVTVLGESGDSEPSNPP